jgi:hypothetical protein
MNREVPDDFITRPGMACTHGPRHRLSFSRYFLGSFFNNPTERMKMALETLKGLTEINGQKVIVMDELREQYPERFTETGAMDHKWFEETIRPNAFIYVRQDKNSLSFTLQNGPIKEVGVNGCQVVDVIAVAKRIIEELNKNFPCNENSMTITKLDEALMWQEKRTRDREARGVEGLSKQ